MNCLNCNSKRLKYVNENDEDMFVCLDCNYKYPKQYFFVSHSHLDIEKVRIIRNVIEETFFYEPILFFLKSVKDNDELTNLIRREIYERIWFIYCVSGNASKSKYVSDEVKYAKELIASGRKINYVEIDLGQFNIWDDECYEYIRKQIQHVIKKTKAFISYAHRDSAVAQTLKKLLEGEGITTWIDTSISMDFGWGESIKSELKNHSYKDGMIFLLVTDRAIQSQAFLMECREAITNGGMVIPVFLVENLFVLEKTRAAWVDIFKHQNFPICAYLTLENLENDFKKFMENYKLI